MDIRTLASSGYNLWGETSTTVNINLIDSTYNIWVGTNASGISEDWISTGVGLEDVSAAYEGNTGLLINNVSDSSSVLLHSTDYVEVNINNYNFLSFWLNIRNWEIGKDITLSLYSTINKSSTYLSLSTYVDFYKLQQWQRILIPLERLNVRQSVELEGSPTYINEIEFVLQSGIDFWLDNVALVVGDISFEGVLIPVMSPVSNT
jgi:hypothetical protein